jgi:hypothetical protein
MNHSNENIRIVQLRARRIPATLFKVDEKLFQLANSNRVRRIRMRLRTNNWNLGNTAFVSKGKEYFGHESWIVNIPDTRMLGCLKTDSYLEASVLEEFDYLITTNSSTYIDLVMLQNFLDNAPQFNFVAGQLLETFGPGLRTLNFPHGCFRIMSKDVLQLLVTQKSRRPLYFPEDHYLGIKLKNIHHTFVELPICNQFEEDGENFTPKYKTIAYRCRHSSNQARIDSRIMKSLHKQLNNKA